MFSEEKVIHKQNHLLKGIKYLQAKKASNVLKQILKLKAVPSIFKRERIVVMFRTLYIVCVVDHNYLSSPSIPY